MTSHCTSVKLYCISRLITYGIVLHKTCFIKMADNETKLFITGLYVHHNFECEMTQWLSCVSTPLLQNRTSGRSLCHYLVDKRVLCNGHYQFGSYRSLVVQIHKSSHDQLQSHRPAAASQLRPLLTQFFCSCIFFKFCDCLFGHNTKNFLCML